ncbi:MAG: NAD(P)-dependent oxidoreductase [Thermoguttaceae bacterium]
MRETILVTEGPFAKGEAVFRAADTFDLQPAPQDESQLARMVVKRNCRAVIVGALPYVGPLYEALGRTGQGRGAILARFGVGHDSIDKTLAQEHQIVVTNTPGVLEASVAEHTLWLIGSLAKRIPQFDARMRAGQFTAETGVEVCGKTLGIIGFGAIGRRVAAIAHFGFRMRVLAVGASVPEQLEHRLGKSLDEIRTTWGLDAYTGEADEVFRQADIVSLHLPAKPDTRHFVDARRMALMKPGAWLINTARGSVVDELALYDALATGRLGGAALDVFQHEPYQPLAPDKDLRTLANVVLTPHTGSNTVEANRAMAQAALENAANFLAGRLERLNRVA